MQAVQILGQAAIDRFSEFTLYLHKSKGMLDFAANGRFLALDYTLPILPAMVASAAQLAGPTVDPVINAGKILARTYLRPFLNAKIAGIAIHDRIVFPDQG